MVLLDQRSGHSTLLRAYGSRRPASTGHSRIATLDILFVALSVVSHRISYLFYVLPLVPAYGVAAALTMWHEGLPRACRWGFMAALALGFVAYFPFREILS